MSDINPNLFPNGLNVVSNQPTSASFDADAGFGNKGINIDENNLTSSFIGFESIGQEACIPSAPENEYYKTIESDNYLNEVDHDAQFLKEYSNDFIGTLDKLSDVLKDVSCSPWSNASDNVKKANTFLLLGIAHSYGLSPFNAFSSFYFMNSSSIPALTARAYAGLCAKRGWTWYFEESGDSRTSYIVKCVVVHKTKKAMDGTPLSFNAIYDYEMGITQGNLMYDKEGYLCGAFKRPAWQRDFKGMMKKNALVQALRLACPDVQIGRLDLEMEDNSNLSKKAKRQRVIEATPTANIELTEEEKQTQQQQIADADKELKELEKVTQALKEDTEPKFVDLNAGLNNSFIENTMPVAPESLKEEDLPF